MQQAADDLAVDRSPRCLHATDRRSGGKTQHTAPGYARERRCLAWPLDLAFGLSGAGAGVFPAEESLVTAVLPRPRTADQAERVATPRRYLMCRPEHFTVEYAINPWMDVTRGADRDARRPAVGDPAADLPGARPRGRADRARAGPAGHGLRGQRRARRRGPGPRCPVHPRRAARRGPGLPAPGWDPGLKTVTEPVHVNEGEGDFLVVGDLVLAGTGFRTDPGAHTEVQELFGVPVVSLQLVDPRFYHLDIALAVLGDARRRLLPGGVQPGQPGGAAAAVPGRGPGHRGRRRRARAQRGVRRAQRRAARRGDRSRRAAARARLRTRSGVDLSELLKAGGSVKCCTMEIRA